MPPIQPQSPNPDFDFMLKNQAPTKRRLGLPALNKPLKIGLAVLVVIIILILLSSVLGKPAAGTTDVSAALARGAEIQRVTTEVSQLNLQDASAKALAATVATSLSSDRAQLEQYLKANKSSVSQAQLAADIDKSTDSLMQSASQNNNLDQTYETYLRQALAIYQTNLQTAYNATGPKGKAILKASFDGVNTLLSTAPLKA